ncbi:MAG: hypothetical protein JW969_14740 [Spirochaetales bacterium]|nr:hypothetical protein [Spirochaetales bacterium]
MDKEKNLCFNSVKEAVNIINRLLCRRDWVTLSAYYDLSNADIDIEDMKNGSFFIKNDKPENAHPGEFWRYKHPFAPGFQYEYHTETEDNRIQVNVSMEIDEGGGMIRRGITTFTMIKLTEGYKILPPND